MAIQEPRRHSTGQNGKQAADGEVIAEDLMTNDYNGEENKSVPHIDLSLSVDRRRQSIEGSIIMAEAYNNLASLGVVGNGIGSTGENEYDSGNQYTYYSVRYVIRSNF